MCGASGLSSWGPTGRCPAEGAPSAVVDGDVGVFGDVGGDDSVGVCSAEGEVLADDHDDSAVWTPVVLNSDRHDPWPWWRAGRSGSAELSGSSRVSGSKTLSVASKGWTYSRCA